jgi:glycosyltransferase involved in cell wall biosynthesis
MNKPLLSVLMTVFNREAYVAEAIESVFSSYFKDFELIILDDASTDKSVEIINKYVSKDSRIKFYKNEQNLGQFKTRNKIVEYATGTYLMWLDSDDKTFDFSFQLCVETMLKNPVAEVGLLCRQKELCNKILPPSESINHHFFVNQFLIIGPGGTIIKKDFFRQINGFPEIYGAAGDMYFNLKFATYGNIICICEEFLFYRTHSGQELNNPYSYLYNNYLYMKDALKNLPLPLAKNKIKFLEVKNKRRFFVNTINYFLQSKNIIKTIGAFKKANFGFKDVIIALVHKNYLKN